MPVKGNVLELLHGFCLLSDVKLFPGHMHTSGNTRVQLRCIVAMANRQVVRNHHYNL